MHKYIQPAETFIVISLYFCIDLLLSSPVKPSPQFFPFSLSSQLAQLFFFLWCFLNTPPIVPLLLPLFLDMAWPSS